MAKNKFRVMEFTPTANQQGSHSFYAQAVVDNVITNKELAKKIEARGISRAAEIKSILEEAANIIIEGDGTLTASYTMLEGGMNWEKIKSIDGCKCWAYCEDLLPTEGYKEF